MTRVLTVAVLAALAALTFQAPRVDPARVEYKPGAYFPSGFPLHGEVKLLSSPIAEMGRRERIRVEYTVGDIALEP
ncbi:MAG: hypothetical protein ACRD96_02010, partial [Bryobacteraceae bacterium]